MVVRINCTCLTDNVCTIYISRLSHLVHDKSGVQYRVGGTCVPNSLNAIGLVLSDSLERSQSEVA